MKLLGRGADRPLLDNFVVVFLWGAGFLGYIVGVLMLVIVGGRYLSDDIFHAELLWWALPLAVGGWLVNRIFERLKERGEID